MYNLVSFLESYMIQEASETLIRVLFLYFYIFMQLVKQH